jgi:transcriptional regulator with XRE-family HTH domain
MKNNTQNYERSIERFRANSKGNEVLHHYLGQLPEYNGGKLLMPRLCLALGNITRQELCELLNVSTGTMSTWMTRDSVPFEIIIRIHLFTNLSIPYLLFGEQEYIAGIDLGKSSLLGITLHKEFSQKEKIKVPVKYLTNGVLVDDGEMLLRLKRINGQDFIYLTNTHEIIDVSVNKVTDVADYLYSVNNQAIILGKMTLMPDGFTYVYMDEERFRLEPNTFSIHGRVAKVL